MDEILYLHKYQQIAYQTADVIYIIHIIDFIGTLNSINKIICATSGTITDITHNYSKFLMIVF